MDGSQHVAIMPAPFFTLFPDFTKSVDLFGTALRLTDLVYIGPKSSPSYVAAFPRIQSKAEWLSPHWHNLRADGCVRLFPNVEQFSPIPKAFEVNPNNFDVVLK